MMAKTKPPAMPVSAVQKTYELGPWLLERIAGFPRSHRFTLGEKIESGYLEVLELLIQAAYSREKLPFLSRANTRLEVLRYLVRLAKDLQCLRASQYAHAVEHLDVIGKEVGGWQKQQSRLVMKT